ncbi:MAG TPA: SAM-dependent methyltransferase [Chitinophagales bacterium]|nr:SAM-dependent methyltransferase [Chitinophagales bacterium]
MSKLFLIPTELDAAAPDMIPAEVHRITSSLDLFFTEKERTARRYLRKTGYDRSFDEVAIHRLDKDTTQEEMELFIRELSSRNGGLLSEAGLPCVADPGAGLVALAHQNGIRVVPLSGPSSLMLALMASGFNGQQFAFNGYLPVQSAERKEVLRKLEHRIYSEGQTQLFIETPYRNGSLFQDIMQCCRPDTWLCVASGLTGEGESVRSMPVSSWKKKHMNWEKVPAVFVLGRPYL